MHYHSTEIAAVVSPAPTEQSTSLSSGRRLRCTSVKAKGMLALEVLPTFSTLTKKRSKGMPLRLAAAFKMRPLAWCGITQRVSSGFQPLCGHGLANQRGKTLRGKTEQGVAVDADPRIAMPVGQEVTGGLAAGHVDAPAVAADLHVADAMARRAGRNDRRPRAVAEKEIGVPIGRIQEPRLHLHAHRQHVPRQAREDHPPGVRHGIQPAAAGGVEIEGRHGRQTEAFLEDGRGGGDGHVGRGRGHDDRVDIAGVQPRVANGLQRRP